jgi:YVTN family beta-propeller protein
MVLSPEGDRVVLLLNGWREQGVQVVDRSTGSVLQTLAQPAAFIGLAFSPDGKTLYASGGNQDVVYRYDWRDRAAILRDSITLAIKPDDKDGTRYPAGLALSRDGRTLYVAENLADSIAIVDVASGNVLQRVAAGRYPYAVVEDSNGNLIVSAWGDDDVVVIAPRSAAAPAHVIGRIQVGRHPSALLLDASGTRLYAVSASTDRVSVVDLQTRKIITELHATPPAGPGEGSTPNALALSPDGQRLYVAEADNNAVAVWELAGSPKLIGRVPVAWYPTALVAAGDTLLVVNGKGNGTLPNRDYPQPGTGAHTTKPRAYTLGQLDATLTTLSARELSDDAIAVLSRRVTAANGWNRPKQTHRYPPFQHVIYVIKENRTYDQILGDMPQGDGDTALVFFPRKISPNHHALADRFGLFDRFFVNAEVSADGHNWSTAAYTTDYLQKTVPSSYSDRGRHYDYEGTNRGVIPNEVGEDDAAEPANGYLWDLAERARISFRNYGEYVEHEDDDRAKYKGTKPFLAKHTHPTYPGYDLNISDQVRADVYIAELQQFVQQGSMPRLQILRLPNDHTAGARAGAPTPWAYMADNDRALGRIVEAISRTPFWRNTVLFVLEDDAQNGPDHVDSHRSPLFVISPYNRGGVIHRFANTTDVIATMAEILALGSLSQFDHFGRPLRDIFASTPDFTPYVALPATVQWTERNPRRGAGADASRGLNLDGVDRADDELFNRILWQTIKGPDKSYPGPTRMSALETKR